MNVSMNRGTDSGPKHENVALIIDDTEVIRSLLSDALTEKGFAVTSAANAKTGLEMVAQVRPNLVFCDTYMPDLDGYETIRRIRKMLPDVVIVMTNSLPRTTAGARDCEIGGEEDDYDFLLNKPFGLSELWAVVDEIRSTLSRR